MKRLRKHLTREEVNDEEGDLEMADSVAYQHTDLTREEVNDEEGDLEMADSVAYQHTDGYRNHDGSYKLHGIKK